MIKMKNTEELKHHEVFNQINQTVHEWEKPAIALLKNLISCNTTDYNEVNGQKIVLRFIESMDCEIYHVKPEPERLKQRYEEFNIGHSYENRHCLVAVFRGVGEGRSLILNSHIDTVFPAAPEKWNTNPFSPEEIGDRIYGLGACDTKAGLAAILTAIKLLSDMSIKLEGDVIFESVVDEEAGGGNGTLACIDAGFKADAVLVTEPTNLVPMCAHVGSYALKLTVFGESAHGNLKHEGVSAFEKALPLILGLKELESKWRQRKNDILPSPVLTIVDIRAGDGSITLPDKCEMLVNYTYLPDQYDYESEINELITSYENQDPWFATHPIKTEIQHNVKPYYTNSSSSWPLMAAKCVSMLTGESVDVAGMGCGSDARLFANLGNMNTIVLGPGNISDAHKPNEFVEIRQFLDAVKIYAAIICEWCGIAN